MRLTSVYCVECLCGRHIESEIHILTCLGCQHVIVIELPATDEAKHQKPETIKTPTAA
jgi:hypothetical protein